MRARGFTLLELVLVLLLVSIVSGMAVPFLRGFLAGRRTADATAQLLALAQYARTQAISDGAVYRLNVDTGSRTYWLSVQRGPEFRELRNEFGRHFSLPDNTFPQWRQSGAAPHEYFAFYPDGRAEAETLVLNEDGGGATLVGCRSETEPLTVLQDAQ